MKAKEDPRTTASEYMGDCYYSDDDYDEDDDSSCDSEESSTESSASRDREPYNKESDESNKQEDHVLVVAGCKSCLMYYMVPKHYKDCPKCNAHLLHFDRSQTASP